MVRVRWCDRGGFWISSWLLVWLGVSCCVGVLVGFGAPCGFGGVRAVVRGGLVGLALALVMVGRVWSFVVVLRGVGVGTCCVEWGSVRWVACACLSGGGLGGRFGSGAHSAARRGTVVCAMLLMFTQISLFCKL